MKQLFEAVLPAVGLIITGLFFAAVVFSRVKIFCSLTACLMWNLAGEARIALEIEKEI